MRILIPLEIVLRNMEHLPALDSRVRELAAQPEKFGSQIIHFHVTIEAPHRHPRRMPNALR